MAIPKRLDPFRQEHWHGAASLPRVYELLAHGVKMKSIAERFGVSRQNIYQTMQRARENPLAPTGKEGQGNPEGSPVTAVTKSTVPDPSHTKEESK